MTPIDFSTKNEDEAEATRQNVKAIVLQNGWPPCFERILMEILPPFRRVMSYEYDQGSPPQSVRLAVMVAMLNMLRATLQATAPDGEGEKCRQEILDFLRAQTARPTHDAPATKQ